MTAAIACLVLGITVSGCADGTSGGEPTAEQLLDDANRTMNALKSVTVDGESKVTAGDGYSSHLTTDLKTRCAAKTTWVTGAALEQIRIGETDYVRPNRAYLAWAGREMTGTKEQTSWIKAPSSQAQPGDGLVECPREFTSFGVATKGDATRIDGSPVIPLVVTDKADKGGSYTFYVATEGKPYILKVTYKGADYQSTTLFSDFDKPLDVRTPAEADVVDVSASGS